MALFRIPQRMSHTVKLGNRTEPLPMTKGEGLLMTSEGVLTKLNEKSKLSVTFPTKCIPGSSFPIEIYVSVPYKNYKSNGDEYLEKRPFFLGKLKTSFSKNMMGFAKAAFSEIPAPPNQEGLFSRITRPYIAAFKKRFMEEETEIKAKDDPVEEPGATSTAAKESVDPPNKDKM